MLAFLCPKSVTSRLPAETYPVSDHPWHSASLDLVSSRGKAGACSLLVSVLSAGTRGSDCHLLESAGGGKASSLGFSQGP